jgi:predicted MFS family arabinose efflux permease
MGGCGVVSHALARTAFPLLLPEIETELLSNRQQSGLLGSANFVAYLIGVALVTTISGRVEPIRILIGGLTTATVGFAIHTVANGFWPLAAGQTATGLAGAALWMSAPTIATAATAPERRGMVMGFISSSMGFGILAAGQGTNLVRTIADDDTLWRPTWIGAAIFTLALLALTLTVIRVPATEPVTGGISMARLRTVPRWPVLCFGYLLSGIVASSFAPFYGLLLKDQGFSPNHITNLFSLLGLAAVLGAINLGRISDRIGRPPVLTGASLTIAAAALLALIGREPFAAIAIAAFGAASFTFPVLTVAHLRDHLEDRAFANALGALTLIYGIGLIAGPAISGTVADTDLGLETVFVGFAVVATITAITMSFLPSHRHAR